MVTSRSTDKNAAHVDPRPFLKWAGGKARLIPQYEPYLPEQIFTYYEPFLGGGALFFYLSPRLKRAVLTDLNPELVNVYCCIRDQVEAVIELLQKHQHSHGKEHYYEVRSQTGLSPIQRAARLIYLNKTCYNGLYRENSKGKFNVPMGRYKKPRICAPALLRAASKALAIADIQVRPFQLITDQKIGVQDFVYFDPPYHPISTTSKFTSYSRYDFREDDQIQLQQTFDALAQRQVSALLSNSDCDFIRDLYAGFPTHTITAARSINSNAQKRGKITEVLVASR